MRYLLPTILAIIFLVTGIFTISDYGMNWDSPMLMLRGQAFAHIYLTGQPNYGLPDRLSPFMVDPDEYASRFYLIPAERLPPGTPKREVKLPERPLLKAEFENMQKGLDKRISFYQDEAWNGSYWIENDGPGHLPLIDILGALSNRLFWGGLGGWGELGGLGDIESYQLVYVLISAIGVFLVSLFAYQITGSYLASVVAGLCLALFPAFFAEAHINSKDPAQAVFFLGAVWAFWNWVHSHRVKWFGGVIIFLALALGTKWNIVFLPAILFPWLILIKFRQWGRLGRLGILGGLGIIIFLIAIWPYSWSDPLGRLASLFGFYSELGVRAAEFKITSFVPVLLLFQTPEIVLILGGIGVIWGIRERGGRMKVGYLLLAWLLVPILRASTPGTWGYGEIRQIMEVVPALALLAGVGGWYLSAKWKVQSAKWGMVGLVCILLLIPIIKLHPNQNAYFNVLVGGLKGAADKGFVDWGITYGNIYKQGIKWLNTHAEKDANLAHLSGSDYAISPLWLRDDISLSPYHFSTFRQKGEYILSLYNPLDPPVFAYQYPQKFLQPVHQIMVDEVPLLTIYKNDK